MPRGTEHTPKTTWPPKERTMGNTKRLLTAISPAGKLTFPNADSAAQRDSDARHDAIIAHEQREVIRELVEAALAAPAPQPHYSLARANAEARLYKAIEAAKRYLD